MILLCREISNGGRACPSVRSNRVGLKENGLMVSERRCKLKMVVRPLIGGGLVVGNPLPFPFRKNNRWMHLSPVV